MSESLFKYSLRVSPRAKNPRLKITLREGLEVIVPKGYDTSKVPAILRKKRHWINATLERMDTHRRLVTPTPKWQLPTSIYLAAPGETWHVESRESEYGRVAVREVAPRQILAFGNLQNEHACKAALRRWLIRRARQSLIPMLEEASKRTSLRYERVFIKCQRTRWASCSRNHAISLNAKLLFLEPRLVEYCMIHELCHVEEMNHSRRFWSLVRYNCLNYEELDRSLRDAWTCVPRWV